MCDQDVVFTLTEYNARFYSPSLHRFTQPDTIIPGPGNSQAWNRYSYAYNNPIKFTDPSGHVPLMDGDSSLFEDLMEDYEPPSPTPGREEGPQYKGYDGEPSCQQSLKECYWDGELKVYYDQSDIDPQEFFELEIAIYVHLISIGDITRFDLFRGHFDTPIWNGFYTKYEQSIDDPSTILEVKVDNSDSTLCLNGKCSKRSEINYFAQGMWAAAAGETLPQANKDAKWYKNLTRKGDYNVSEVNYWITYGWNKYHEFVDAFGVEAE